MRNVLSAFTTYPNTPETDAMPEVQHTVKVDVNGTVYGLQVMAGAPDEAIDKVHKASDAEFSYMVQKASSMTFPKK